MTSSPDNYSILKGKVYFKPTGAPGWTDLGNCTKFDWTPESETLDHFSSRDGVKTKDKTVIVSKSITIDLTLDEWNNDNLALAVLGEATTVDGNPATKLFASNSIRGELKIEGSNEVGPVRDFVFYAVDFIPGGALSLISEEWGEMSLKGTAASVDGDFGYYINRSENVPTNSILPSISTSVAQEGVLMTAVVGEWTGDPVFTYVWKADGTPIALATSATYTPVVGDVGKAITVTVTATNTAGALSKTSAATVDVIAA